MRLNDDCWLAILEFLSLDDLLVVQQCNKWFHEKSHELILRNKCKGAVVVHDFPSRALKRYGNLITNVNVLRLEDSNIAKIHKLCPTLTALTLNRPDIAVFRNSQLADIFCNRLSKLSINFFVSSDIHYPDVERALDHCKKLTHLSLFNWRFEKFVSTKLPLLREFIIQISADRPKTEMLQRFLHNNRDIQTLKISQPWQAIDVSGVLNLKHLIDLDVKVRINNLTNFINGLSTTIRKLSITQDISAFPSFGHLKQLTSLEISNQNQQFDAFRNMHLIEIMKLPNLTGFTYFQLGKPTVGLNDIVQAVKLCPQLKMLEFHGFLETGQLCTDSLYEQFKLSCQRDNIRFRLSPIDGDTKQWNSFGNILNAVRNVLYFKDH